MDNYTFLDVSTDNNSTTQNLRPHVSSLVPATMFAAGVFGNSLALFVLSRAPADQKKTVFYRLVAALAFTDLFGTCATSPVTLLIYSNNLKWLGGQPLCDYFSFMLIFAGLSTVFIIGAMAFDRYMALKHPYVYHAKIQPKHATFIIVALWLVAIFVALLPKFGLGRNVHQYPGTWCFFAIHGNSTTDKAFAILYSCFGIIIIVTIAILNIVLISTLCRMRKTAPPSHSARNVIQCEIQMAIFLVGVMFVFSVCYGPLMFRILIIQMGLDEKNTYYDLLVIRLASFNQILDPWVYLLFRRELVSRIFIILQKQLCPKSFQRSQKSRQLQFERTLTTEKMVTVAQSSEGAASPVSLNKYNCSNNNKLLTDDVLNVE